MRGGLDDALDKLARRDELRRRATGENPGTPPAVTELVEAIAGVIARNPQLAVTVGVEGAGDPVLLHFGFADGVVQVSADNSVATRAAEAEAKHADFEIDVDPEPVYAEPVYTEPAYSEPAYSEPVYAEPAYSEPPRASRDDQDRFGPTDFDYEEPPTAERPFVSPSSSEAYEPAPHPFAATPPPPVPPQTPLGYASPQAYPEPQAYAEPQPPQPAAQPGFPQPLAKPIPLKVERPEETEQAARRLAALLRDDPTLLDAPHD
ncbi:hypothetical protein B0I29_124105 [Actinoplanes lutulentus]|uniref:Uncharacterized protein n=1 Tax=Actinoplanes lutulentus TaxID=1287878 RepID=A0A327Z461_9ACTN|nr:hypothetical protein B0I29_124105 [Actinoplanes lutulentus]